jgi:hypothetical protein
MKIICIQSPTYDYLTSTLIEGLQLLGHTIMSTENSNYQKKSNDTLLKKNAESTNIVNLWLKAVHDNPLLFTDYYNSTNQNFEFKDSRHDQSVLSVICKLNKIIKLDDETFFPPDGNFGGEQSLKYPFWATRIRE